ncbi:PKD domain-containing protein [Dactylosporangium sp. NPDC049140]|uniref:PKD domain-containing protein n=1 Tax=Dactylosporangium sp. NPDC049140 TaxID=3155647 RepID=UPI0033F6FC61
MGTKYPLSGLALVAVAAGAALVAGAGPAGAETVPALYVQFLAPTGCTDAGPGTAEKPYCTIGAALAAATAGQTINVTGTYNEHVTFPRSGEPGRPITLRGNGGARLAGGPGVGFTIADRHDIAISGIDVAGSGPAAAIDVITAQRIAVDNLSIRGATGPAKPAVRLAGVTDSSLTAVDITTAELTTGIALDATTSGVLVKSASVWVSFAAPGGRGIEVLGSHNTILSNDVIGGGEAGIALRPGADGNVVANNTVSASTGAGIDNAGATGTAITNNRVQDNCKGGVWVSGASAGVSVQNNVLRLNMPGADNANCDRSQPAAEIGIYDGAAGRTVADYNNVYHGYDGTGAPNTYAWSGTAMGLTAFRAASGQAAHDLEASNANTIDNANSAAPGWPSADRTGNPREDDPAVPDHGAGPVPYGDRGPTELTKGPTAALALKADHAGNSLTADASGTRPGYSPVTTYAFDFGDGTKVTQAAPVASHHYARPGTYTVQVLATDANGFSGLQVASASLWPTARTIALLADNGRYVNGGPEGYNFLSLYARAVGPGELFEVVDLGNGHVGLRSRVNQTYLGVNYGPQALLSAGSPSTEEPAKQFDLVTNADGSISLRSLLTNAYVSSNSGLTQVLTADRAAIGPWERFGAVDTANTSITLHAHANARYVAAENGGNAPLIANRTAAGLWETYDLVDAGNGWVALYSHANGKFVTAENGGNAALIANRTAIGPWEKFKVVKNADGSTSLLAGVNGKYVCAENGGNSPLIANRTAIGAWEEFDRG